MEKKSFGFKGLVSTIVVLTILIVFILFFASFKISIAEKPVLFLISGVFVMCVLMLLYEALCYRFSYKSEQKALNRAHEIELQRLKFDQEQKWQDIAKIKQERDEFEAKNKALEAKCEGLSAGKDALDREQQIMAMYLLTLYNSKKTSPEMKTSFDVNITSDEVKKILEESIESCKVIKNKLAEIKDKGL